MKISDIAEVINETVKEPSKSGIDVFVGLEHYDIAEPVIKRFGSTQMLSTAAKVFKKGDVLIARRNVYLQRAAMASFSGLTSGDSIVLRVKDNFDTKETDYETMSKLLPFILNSIDFWDYANTNADGTMSKRLSPALLLDYEFDLPSIEEQKLRAEKLWAAYEVKQSYLKMIKATQEMVQSQFIEMFGTATTTVQIKEICSVVSGKSIPTRLEDIQGNVPYIKVADFNLIGNEKYIASAQRYVAKESAEYSKMIPVGSVVFAKNGAASLSNKKRLTKIECCIDMNTMAIIPKTSEILPEFLFAIIQAMDISAHVRQGAIPSISPKSIEEYSIVLPSVKEQAKYITKALQADKSEFELKKSIEAIDAVIKSLINS